MWVWCPERYMVSLQKLRLSLTTQHIPTYKTWWGQKHTIRFRCPPNVLIRIYLYLVFSDGCRNELVNAHSILPRLPSLLFHRHRRTFSTMTTIFSLPTRHYNSMAFALFVFMAYYHANSNVANLNKTIFWFTFCIQSSSILSWSFVVISSEG